MLEKNTLTTSNQTRLQCILILFWNPGGVHRTIFKVNTLSTKLTSNISRILSKNMRKHHKCSILRTGTKLSRNYITPKDTVAKTLLSNFDFIAANAIKIITSILSLAKQQGEVNKRRKNMV